MANGHSTASNEIEFTVSSPCAFTLNVTLNTSGQGTVADIALLGDGLFLDFTTTGGSEMGVLQPGSYGIEIDIGQNADADSGTPSATTHIDYSYTLTLTPQ